jgi:hypothetical protein
MIFTQVTSLGRTSWPVSRIQGSPSPNLRSWVLAQDHSRYLDLDQLPHGFSTRAQIGREQP